MTSSKKSYTVNKIYFPIDDKDQFLKDNDEYFTSLSCVYKTSTFLYEDVLYYNLQLDFVEGKLSQSDSNNIMKIFNKFNKGQIIQKAFYKYKKNNDDLKMTYKYVI